METIILAVMCSLVFLALLKITFAVLTGVSAFRTGGAVYTTTHRSKIDAVLDEVPMRPGQVLYDLGCGDARFLIAAEKRYGVKAVGYEINPWAYALARLRILLSLSRADVRFHDFSDAHLRDADVVFFYLFPDVIPALREKLKRELRPGSRVISCNFEIPGWAPERVITASHRIESDPIYIYRKL